MQQQISIWLDCDPGLDDTLAIIYAAHHPRIKIVGVSTSPGNTDLLNTTNNAINILYNIGRLDIDVYAGSNYTIQGELSTAEIVHGQNGLAGVTVKQSPKKAYIQQSFYEIYLKIMQNQEQIVWTNTGSLTNLCLLLMTFPQVKKKIKKIVLMGGAIQAGNITPAAQFNIYCDPHALQKVLMVKQDIPLVMIPLQVTHQFLASKQVHQNFQKYSQYPFGKALCTMIQHYQQFYIDAHKWPFPPYHDPVTIYYLLYPQDIELKKAIIQVDTGKVSKGRTNCFFRLNQTQQKSITTYVATRMTESLDKFWNQMAQALQKVFSQKVQSSLQ